MADTESHRTTNHQTIRQWAEERGGVPARVQQTGDADDPGLLRIGFPGVGRDEDLEEISWDEFFQKFDEKDLTFLYQEATEEGAPSRFFKFVSGRTKAA